MIRTSRLVAAALCILALGIGCQDSERKAGAPAVAATEAPAVATPDAAPDEDEASEHIDAAHSPKLRRDLGGYHRAISTENELAQRYFDQGMVLTFGFNHEQAIASFREAARQDPNCAICFWGAALAHGPNINLPMSPEAGRGAWEMLQEARARAEHASGAERAYIDALATRYSENPETEDRAALDRAFAEAMGALSERYPDDLDAATLYAESLMDLYPWDYWDDEAKPREHTEEILRVLESVMERDPRHPGANHLYVHAVEEYFPEKGVPSADRLVDIAPESGHLVHMSSHIYWRVGRYSEAVNSNRRAITTDEQLFAWCRGGAFYRVGYYPHNIHFLWASAAAGGQSAAALGAARKLYHEVAGEVEAWPFVQEWMAIPVLTLARFGRWDAVLNEPLPPDSQPYVLAMTHYARSLAELRAGSAERARKERAALDAIASREAMEELLVAGGTAPARQLLGIASAHLAGELAAAEGDFATAEEELRRAVELEYALVYMEPPPWYMPMRQALGAVLLDADRPAEAEAVYRADLSANPKNGWSLFGLAQSLRAQGKETEATLAATGFGFAWERADVALSASRF